MPHILLHFKVTPWVYALGLIYILKPYLFAAFGGIFIVKSAVAVEQ